MDDKEVYRVLNSLDELEDEFTILEKISQEFLDKLVIKEMNDTVPYSYKKYNKR